MGVCFRMGAVTVCLVYMLMGIISRKEELDIRGRGKSFGGNIEEARADGIGIQKGRPALGRILGSSSMGTG